MSTDIGLIRDDELTGFRLMICLGGVTGGFCCGKPWLGSSNDPGSSADDSGVKSMFVSRHIVPALDN